jgi:hypothetical protein
MAGFRESETVEMMRKYAAQESAVLKLHNNSQSSAFEIARLQEEVALWRSRATVGSSVGHATHDLRRPPVHQKGSESEVETLARLSSQWATTCSILADLPINTSTRAGQGRARGRAGANSDSALVVSVARQLVRDVGVLQEDMLITISDLRLAIGFGEQRWPLELRKQNERMLHDMFVRTQTTVQELGDDLTRQLEAERAEMMREKEARLLAENQTRSAKSKLESMQRGWDEERLQHEAEKEQDRLKITELYEHVRKKKTELKQMHKVLTCQPQMRPHRASSPYACSWVLTKLNTTRMARYILLYGATGHADSGCHRRAHAPRSCARAAPSHAAG